MFLENNSVKGKLSGENGESQISRTVGARRQCDAFITVSTSLQAGAPVMMSTSRRRHIYRIIIVNHLLPRPVNYTSATSRAHGQSGIAAACRVAP